VLSIGSAFLLSKENRRMKSRTSKSQGQFVASFLAGSWRVQQEPVDVSLPELELLTDLLYNSGSAGLAWWRIHQSELATTTPGELLHQGYRLQALQSAMQEARIGVAFGLLRDAGIEPILLKGWAVARLYAHRTLRPYGDIDLIVRPDDFARARAILDRSETPTWWIDLHQSLVELNDRSVDDLFQRSRIETHNGVHVRILSDEDHLALLAMHFFKHSGWRPSGLCDVAVMVESLSDSFDWSLCLGPGKSRRAWIASALVLAEQLLGADIVQTPKTLRSYKVAAWLLDTVLKQWGNLRPADSSLPGEPLPVFLYSLRDPRTLLRDVCGRWPDPITATLNLRARPNNWPRLPYQLGAFISRAGQSLLDRLRAT
jgi:hypothetical protein